MRGTEKQITWATDIINKIVPVLEQAAIDIGAMTGDETIKTANVAGIQQRIDALKSAEYAGDVISIFGRTRLTGEQSEDFKAILAEYRVAKPMSQGEKRILCK